MKKNVREFSPHRKQNALNEWGKLGYGSNKAQIVADKYGCSIQSLYIWKSRYDGNIESLANGSHAVHNVWNKYTAKELAQFKRLTTKYQAMGNSERYYLLQTKHAYTKSVSTYYRMKRAINVAPYQKLKKYIRQDYNTPDMVGVKWQIDVKYVPKECIVPELYNKYYQQGTKKYFTMYQYTCIDECSRKRFMYAYDSLGTLETIDFIKRCIVFFGYKPCIIQTDNGGEFANNQSEKPSAVTMFLESLNITHKRIRPYTPRHNGKVERSHKTDNQEFYAFQQFTSLDDVRNKMQNWVYRYNNNRPHSALKMKTPQQYENMKLEILHQKNYFEFPQKDGEIINGSVKFVRQNIDWAFTPRELYTA